MILEREMEMRDIKVLLNKNKSIYNLIMYRSFIRRNITSVAIIIFVIFFCGLQMAAPHFLYNDDGSLRQFGIGYKKKTVIPNWLVALILAIFSYLFVLYYLAIPKFKF
jgi:hypothetical protein